MTCRSGCVTKDHGSYAECLQSANVTVSAVINSPLQSVYENTKADLRAYAAAKANGIQPSGTSREKVHAAEAASNLLGRPYNAHKDAPAPMVQTKTHARLVNALSED